MASGSLPLVTFEPINLYIAAAANGRHIGIPGQVHRIEGGWLLTVPLIPGDEPLALFFADGRAKVLPWIAGQLGIDITVLPTPPAR